MASNIFKTIIQRKIDIFLNTFTYDSESIFKNKANKLIHPGEYGMFREACLKELLACILNKDMGVSDGFIITSSDSVSTQCDILIYNSNIMPLVDDSTAKFFPVESINGIGEVKSDLTKAQLKEALRKMAKNKFIGIERKGTYKSRFNHFKEYDYIFSFLVCKKLKFDIKDLNFEEIYEGIPREYWHNAILSLEDGYIGYKLNPKEFPDTMLENFKKAGGNPNCCGRIWEFPIHKEIDTYNCKINIVNASSDDIYKHINSFLVTIRCALEGLTQYEFDICNYLENQISIMQP